MTYSQKAKRLKEESIATAGVMRGHLEGLQTDLLTSPMSPTLRDTVSLVAITIHGATERDDMEMIDSLDSLF